MLIYLKLVLMAVFWGGTFAAGRIVSQEAGPFTAAFLRFLIASVFLVLLTRRFEAKLPRLTARQMLLAALLGLTGIFLYNVFFFQGLKTVTASRAAVIIPSNPVFIFLLSIVLFRERFTWLKATGVFLSACGAILVITHGNPAGVLEQGIGIGELFIVGCVAAWVAYSLLGKLIVDSLAPMAAVTYACLFGLAGLALPMFLETGLADLSRLSWPVWVALFYLGFFGTALGFTWYYQGIQRLGPAKASVFINLVPVSGVLLGWLLLGESIDMSIGAGAVLVILGVILINRQE